MAGKKITTKVKLSNHTSLKKLTAAVCLLSFVVVLIAGMQVDGSYYNRVLDVVFYSLIAMMVIKVVMVIVIRILTTYEEMNSGQS